MNHPDVSGRRRWQFVVATMCAFAAVGMWASPAAAHAVVTSSDPANNSRSATAPTTVSIQFSESVSVDVGGLRVLDQTGTEVNEGPALQPTPASLRAPLKPGLGNGTYVANWRVISADGHALSGAIVFVVGKAGTADVSRLETRNDPVTEVLAGLARWLLYVSALTAAGLAFFVAFVHDGAADRARVGRLIRRATAVAGLAVMVLIGCQTALATGRGSGALDVSAVRSVLRQGLGWQCAVLLVGLALAFLVADVRGKSARCVTGLLALVLTGGSFALWGHAGEAGNRALAMSADAVHAIVAGSWLGGLVGLGLVIGARARGVDQPGDDEPGSVLSTAAMVLRFSTQAAISVALLAVSGIVLSVSELGSISALTTTAYGTTLLVKLALVAMVLATAALNRWRLVPWIMASVAEHEGLAEEHEGNETVDRGTDTVVEWKTLVRTLRLEALGIAAVLAVTAVLVQLTPAANLPPGPDPFVGRSSFRGGQVELVITPNHPGSNAVHVTYTNAEGRIADTVRKSAIEFRLPAKGVGPLSRELLKAGSGHFLAEDVNEISIAGEWEITVVSRVTDFDQERTVFHDTVT